MASDELTHIIGSLTDEELLERLVRPYEPECDKQVQREVLHRIFMMLSTLRTNQ